MTAGCMAALIAADHDKIVWECVELILAVTRLGGRCGCSGAECCCALPGSRLAEGYAAPDQPSARSSLGTEARSLGLAAFACMRIYLPSLGMRLCQ